MTVDQTSCQTPSCAVVTSRGARRSTVLAGGFGAALCLAAGLLEAQETSVTIYQSGRALVRRTFAVAVPRGASTLSLDLGARNVDPGTLVALDDGVEIRGVTEVAGTGPEAALRRAVGRDIDFMVMSGDSGPRFIHGTVLSLDPQAVRIAGRVIYGFPGTPAFPDSLVALAPSLAVTVVAARAKPAAAPGLSGRRPAVARVVRAGRAARGAGDRHDGRPRDDRGSRRARVRGRRGAAAGGRRRAGRRARAQLQRRRAAHACGGCR